MHSVLPTVVALLTRLIRTTTDPQLPCGHAYCRRCLDELREPTQRMAAELRALQAAAEEQAPRLAAAEEEASAAATRAQVAELELSRYKQARQSHSEATDAKHLLLTQRLEGALRELQTTMAERDRLAAKLEVALSRCTSSLVAKQLAEDAAKAVQQQLDALRMPVAVN